MNFTDSEYRLLNEVICHCLLSGYGFNKETLTFSHYTKGNVYTATSMQDAVDWVREKKYVDKLFVM